MKPIKFRAWSRKWGLVYSDTPGFSIDVHARTVWKDCADDENVELMQFTGLLDSQGVEIWDGDILSHPNGDRFRVEWRQSHCAFRAVYPDGEFEDDRMLSIQVGPVGLAVVIGNIHQHPDLLK